MRELDVLILRLLAEADEPLGSTRLAELLRKRFGLEYTTRTIRYRLRHLEEQGLIERVRRGGRYVGARLTPKGERMLKLATSHERSRMYLSILEEMAYRCTFDPERGQGTVVCNVTVLHRDHLDDLIDAVVETYRAGLAPSPLIAIEEEPPTPDIPVRRNELVVLTVCTVTIDGVLLNHGIPTHPVCGGLLYYEDREPIGFQEYIRYEGTTIDPLHAFVTQRMTSVEDILDEGAGLLPANVRYVPWAAADEVDRIETQLKRADVHGIIDTPRIEGEILGLPLPPRSLGIAACGGLVPIALLEERGITTRTYPTRVLRDYRDLQDARRY